jgi:hypothetical protein
MPWAFNVTTMYKKFLIVPLKGTPFEKITYTTVYCIKGNFTLCFPLFSIGADRKPPQKTGFFVFTCLSHWRTIDILTRIDRI